MRFQYMGWVLTAGLAGVLLGGGFQGKSDKIGVVDVGEVFQKSDLTRRMQEELRSFGAQRMDVLQFVNTYRVFTPDQARRFRDLSLKPTPTVAEKTELEKIKSDAIANDKAFKSLQTKSNPSADDVAKIQEFSSRAQTMLGLEQQWAREFDNEVNDRRDKMREEVLTKIQNSVREVGRKQGYTLVFMREVVPYGANDLTNDTLKAINATK